MKNYKKYRIFIFQPYPKFGGADRSIIRLINGNKNADFTLVSLKRCNYTKYLNKKINYLRINSSRVFYSIFELKKKVCKIIETKNYSKNIFISNQFFANIITALSLTGIKKLKVILIERNHLDELYFYKHFYDFIKKKIMLYLMKINYKKSDILVGISKKMSKDLSRFVNKNVTTIYNPAIDKKIYTKDYDLIDLKKIKNGREKIILNIGFFEKQKDQITILKALKIVLKKIKNIHLILIGRGSKYGELKKFVKKNNLQDNVIFLTNVNNPIKFYKISDLFILSSLYEGFGNVLVESMSNKCPIITSNCKSGPMEIIGNGKYGDYFLPKDYKTLARKILLHFKDPKKLINKLKLSSTHLKKFSLKENAKSFNELFSKI